MTQHLHRLIVIAAANRVNGVASWLNANLGADTVPGDLGPPLNASGSAGLPVTHRWASIALRDGEARDVLRRLCQLGGQGQPNLATWAGWTRAQKRTWAAGVRTAVWTSYGVWCNLSDNDGVWDAPAAALSACGLQVVEAM